MQLQRNLARRTGVACIAHLARRIQLVLHAAK
jgi:hypothetical protein